MGGMRFLKPDEIARIEAVLAADPSEFAPRNRALFAVGLGTGGRIAELLGLKVGNAYDAGGRPLPVVYFEKQTTKGKRRGRSVPVLPFLREALEAYYPWRLAKADGSLEADQPLFISNKGGAVKPDSASRIFRELFQAAGVGGRVATHSLRKTRAQSLLRAGVPLPVIGHVLGHRDVRTTMAYLSIDSEAVEQAIAVADRHYRPADDTPIISLPAAG